MANQLNRRFRAASSGKVIGLGVLVGLWGGPDRFGLPDFDVTGFLRRDWAMIIFLDYSN